MSHANAPTTSEGPTNSEAPVSVPVMRSGSRLGPYVLQSLLGQGGMGSVWSAIRDDSDEKVALKLVRADMAGPELIARFGREAKLLMRFQHPSVARTLDAGVDQGIPYIAMELLVGRPLSAVVKEEAPLAPDRALDLFLRACVGVAVAHAQDIVHRDIKPSNFFVVPSPDGSERVCLLDFGIAKLFDSAVEGATLTQTDMALGTPGYVAPEQFRNAKQADRRADIWSLGMMLFRMLTGKSPFPAESTGEYFAKILSEAPLHLRDHWPDAPSSLELVVARCLRKDPAQRYGDVRSLVEALAPSAPEKARGAIEEIRSLLPFVPQTPDPLLDAHTQPLPSDEAQTRVLPAQPARVPATPERSVVASWKISALAAGGVVLVGLALRSVLFASPNESRTAEPAATSMSVPSVMPTASSAAIATIASAPGSAATPAKTTVDTPAGPASSSRNAPAKPPATVAGAKTSAPQPSAQSGATTVSTGSKLPWSRDLDDKP